MHRDDRRCRPKKYSVVHCSCRKREETRRMLLWGRGWQRGVAVIAVVPVVGEVLGRRVLAWSALVIQ